jgi:hypothetical protein
MSKIVFVINGKKILPKNVKYLLLPKLSYFEFIPEEIFSLIISYIPKVKLLRNISLISKRFETVAVSQVYSLKCYCDGWQISDRNIKKLINIKKLDISYNCKVTNLGIKGLTNLTSLNIECNDNIRNSSVERLINLKYLNMENNSFVTSRGIKDLINLTDLNISYTLMDDVGIKNLTNLKNLNFKCCDFISNKGIKNLTNITHLNIGRSPLVTYKGIKNLSHLTGLVIYGGRDADITKKGIKNLKLPNLVDVMLDYDFCC